ncbi:MAG: anhydro-N-acetylmuramic acid kinase [Bacteroidetes bacterium]|nr:MAG: anhydro-N-acetylmuramic acid kinase [Bacteroidota bacterium]
MKNKQQYHILGVMSGTSLDGVDMALCTFSRNEEEGWDFAIAQATTHPYPTPLKEQLRSLHHADAQTFCAMDRTFGRYLGQQLCHFLQEVPVQPDAIASHGHTIFHNPAEGYTVQIGHGAAIAAETGLPVISDFRSLDVALGGQGAPLVPAGDQALFGEYDGCLNLGGFANISYEVAGKRVAGDISVCNFILNMLAQREGKPFDEGGKMAKQGRPIPQLLQTLNRLPFYQKPFPKSLGREWVEAAMLSILPPGKTNDLMATLNTHIAQQIARAINQMDGETILVTGGGTYNDTLMAHIAQQTPKTLVIPSSDIIDYKEALIFAWLGLKRLIGEANTLSEVTGARANSQGGSIFSFNKNPFLQEKEARSR